MKSNTYDFKFDVFISHSAKDKAVVRPLAERLRADGLSVWFDEWVLKPGDSIPAKIKEGLDHSRMLVLCMSANALGANWMELESHTFQFRDPLHKELRFIPLRLDDAPIKGSLAQFLYIDWRPANREQEYPKLLATCREALGIPKLPKPKPPDALIEQCRKGNCVLYAGAGLSASAMFPTWKSFVTELIDWSERQETISARSIHSLRNAISGGEFNIAADSVIAELEKRNGLPQLHKFLMSTFGRNASLTSRHELLRHLNLSAVLTTNFDNLLERTFEIAAERIFTPSDIDRLLECLTKREFFIAKLYGRLDRPETLLISPAQYEDAIVGNRRFAEFIESVFVSRTLIFLGSSLEGIIAYLEGIRFRGGDQKHFALVAVSEPAWESKADMLKRRYGIQVLPYHASAHHQEIDEFLQELEQHLRPVVRSTLQNEIAGKEDLRQPAKLRRLLLKNIGPFAELDIELRPNWNLLLGDNGVGKSTILRSIALAICGRDAQTYAGRIVRSGQSKAQITLETTSGRSYVTEIFETSSGFEVESLPRRSLDTEGWLVLGFPPIRSATWRKSSGPQGEQSLNRPRVEDLLPLLTSEPDPRLDDVKQWIINLDYWKSKGGSGRSLAYCERIQWKLFEVIKKLTGGLKIDFERIDPKTWEVLVTTDDGVVPLDAVSQGTASVIGWSGVLVQRLFNIYGDADNPMQQNAIVVLDEIDAHMHPLWQQSLVRDLTDLFPNVQFIATTHSPLVTLTSEPGTTLLVQRTGPNHNQIVVQRSELDVRRWRADQVLTTLFGLRSSNPMLYAWMNEYTDLLARDSLDKKEEHRMNYLAGMLEIAPPEPFEREEARLAYQSIKKALDEQLATIPEEKLEEIRKEARAQVLESISGKRRPL
jgi:hypothetical protein